MNKPTKIIAAIALQFVIILSIIIFKLTILVGGTEILLKIAPVDPRSPLRGDYVTFQYDISNLDRLLLTGSLKNGDTIYVTLIKNRSYWVAQRASTKKPIEKNIVFIKGKVINGGVAGKSNLYPLRAPNSSRIQVIYGSEEYFIPEGKGQGFSFVGKEVTASLAVDDEGNSTLKKVFVDGDPWP